MYDTVHFHLPAEAIQAGFTEEVVERVYNALEGVEDKRYPITGERYISGYLGNFRVTMSQRSLKVKGSLCKFVNGNQFAPLLLPDIQRGITAISNALGLPMEKAQIKRLDIAKNIKTNFAPVIYLPLLGNLSRFARLEQENGLYFRTDKCELVFYDKIKEQKRKKPKEIPLEFRNCNLLRYELRFKKNIPKQLNLACITGGTLMEEPFFELMEQEWERRYSTITKVRDLGVMIEDISTPKEFQKYLEYLGMLKLGGEVNVEKIIDMGRKRGKWGHVAASRMRQKTKSIVKAPFVTAESPLIIELDDKVRQLSQDHRNAA